MQPDSKPSDKNPNARYGTKRAKNDLVGKKKLVFLGKNGTNKRELKAKY